MSDSEIALHLKTVGLLQDKLAAAEARLDRARAAMSIAMDALESDSDQAAREKAFEICQGQFEGVTDGRSVAIRDVLNAEHAQWEAEGYGAWPTPPPARLEREG